MNNIVDCLPKKILRNVKKFNPLSNLVKDRKTESSFLSIQVYNLGGISIFGYVCMYGCVSWPRVDFSIADATFLLTLAVAGDVDVDVVWLLCYYSICRCCFSGVLAVSLPVLTAQMCDIINSWMPLYVSVSVCVCDCHCILLLAAILSVVVPRKCG